MCEERALLVVKVLYKMKTLKKVIIPLYFEFCQQIRKFSLIERRPYEKALSEKSSNTTFWWLALGQACQDSRGTSATICNQHLHGTVDSCPYYYISY